MTISKKLLIVGLLALGMHHGAQAYTSDVSHASSQIIKFAQTLRTVNNKHALKVAQWLELQACDNGENCDIAAIASITNNPELSMQSKISILSQTIAAQRNQGIKTTISKTINNICGAIITVAMVGGFTALAIALASLEENKYSQYRDHTLYWSPYYGWYYPPSKPSITIEFRRHS